MSDPVEFTIVQATLKDLSVLRELEKVCFSADAWPLLDLISVLTLPGLVRLKSVVDGKMTGFVGGDTHRNEGIGWITTICVLPEFRRIGIGSALLESCEKQMGQPIVRLTVRPSNTSAIHLYAQKGYYRVDVWKNYYTGGEDGLILEKRMVAAA